MKKLVYIICIAFFVLGCGNNARVKQIGVSQELVSEGIIKNNLASDLPQPEEPKPVRDPDKPLYEGHWMELQETEDGYVVVNYESLWYKDPVRFPNMRIIEDNKFVIIFYSDEINYNYFVPIRKIEELDNDGYYLSLRTIGDNPWRADDPQEADSIFRASGAGILQGGREIKLEWIDKDKRIARISEYNVIYHAGELEPEIKAGFEAIYVDSLYNTFPFVDDELEWEWEN